MKKPTLVIFTLLIASLLQAQSGQPVVNSNLVFEEENGLLAVEAEHFYQQSNNTVRAWHLHSADAQVNIANDHDVTHLADASNHAYLEVLPDTRTTHDDELIGGVNFSNTPGKMAVLHYKVYINNPGRYFVWVRAYSTGSEDNGIHVGLDGDWPESGQRMQWCKGKHAWTWDSKQRTQKVHCGVPHLIYLDIQKAGPHEITFSMREDGFEFDQFLLTDEKQFKPTAENVPLPRIRSGKLPPAYPVVTIDPIQEDDIFQKVLSFKQGIKLMRAINFPLESTNFYQNKQWLAINPNRAQEATTTNLFPFGTGTYDILFLGVGENDGKSVYKLDIDDRPVGTFTSPLSENSFEEGSQFVDLWENIDIEKGDEIKVTAEVGSKDGQEYSRARWSGIVFAPATKGKEVLELLKGYSFKQDVGSAPLRTISAGNQQPAGTTVIRNAAPASVRQADGNGSVTITGEMKQWHKITLSLEGPFAYELDVEPNPFRDYRMTVVFTHASGSPSYRVPGYFAADGNAAETGADQGNIWRAHLSPDKTGTWHYEIVFLAGEGVAVHDVPWFYELSPYHGMKGTINIVQTDKSGRDLRGKGRLEYVGKHYLQFKGTKEYFFKAGADAPETLLAYEDFDGTATEKTPLKKWAAHIKDWEPGDPTWQNGKGKGLIGAVNYLAKKGVNAYSFLTYNAGGDGENVWPFVNRNDKYHYDCSKLDQWQILFDHSQAMGMHLHFKLQEQENDDNRKGKKTEGDVIKESLDGGYTGPQRRLYLRELIARYGYLLALNWNLGEENTQSTRQQRDMAAYIDQLCPYPHNIVVHTFPNWQDKNYPGLLGDQSKITGTSLQNAWNQTHRRTLQWVKASAMIGKPWVVANDEQGSAAHGVPPDPGYEDYDPNTLPYTHHDIRKQTLWANLMAGGAGVEYYFGYKLPQNDLVCEDFRSRDQSWDYCKIAIDFFNESGLPIWEMTNRNDLIGNAQNGKEKYCLAKEGEVYLVYLAYVPTSDLDLSKTEGSFSVTWFNPRTGTKGLKGTVTEVVGGKMVSLENPPSEMGEDWLVIVKKR